MIKKNIYPIELLDCESVNELKKMAPVHTYSAQSELFYEGQTPVVAFLLLEGHIQLIKKKKIRKVLSPGDLIGLRELINHSPFPLSAQILPNTQVCFLDKSTIQDILKDTDSQLSKALCHILNPPREAS